MLPLAPMLPAADLPKIAVILIAGFFTTLFASAGVCIALRETMTLVTGQKPAQLSSIAGGGAPPSNRLITSLAIASALSFALVHMGVSYAMLSYGLFVTLLTFTIGQRFPPLLKRLVHPLITCTLGTQALLWLVSLTTHSTFAAVLATYYTRAAGAAWGGGNVLAYLLGPAVITFAYTMDARRRLAIARGVEVVFTSLFASFASLFGTAYVARLLRMSRTARLLVIPRTITAPLAVAIAEMLGADLGLAASVVALTGLIGANVAAGMLTVFKIKDPVVRGLSVGCSAHGLGTAAVSDEGGAFPFAALAMTLVGVFSTIFVAWAPGRAALLRVALGGVSTIAKM